MGGAPGLHFYTLNMDKIVVGTLAGLNLITTKQAAIYNITKKTDENLKKLEKKAGAYDADLEEAETLKEELEAIIAKRQEELQRANQIITDPSSKIGKTDEKL